MTKGKIIQMAITLVIVVVGIKISQLPFIKEIGS